MPALIHKCYLAKRESDYIVRSEVILPPLL